MNKDWPHSVDLQCASAELKYENKQTEEIAIQVVVEKLRTSSLDSVDVEAVRKEVQERTKLKSAILQRSYVEADDADELKHQAAVFNATANSQSVPFEESFPSGDSSSYSSSSSWSSSPDDFRYHRMCLLL